MNSINCCERPGGNILPGRFSFRRRGKARSRPGTESGTAAVAREAGGRDGLRREFRRFFPHGDFLLQTGVFGDVAQVFQNRPGLFRAHAVKRALAERDQTRDDFLTVRSDGVEDGAVRRRDFRDGIGEAEEIGGEFPFGNRALQTGASGDSPQVA